LSLLVQDLFLFSGWGLKFLILLLGRKLSTSLCLILKFMRGYGLLAKITQIKNKNYIENHKSSNIANRPKTGAPFPSFSCVKKILALILL
jgi:hypothetical protein